MPVTLKELDGLRAQLAADRELCKNSGLAQQYLDSAEAKLDEAEASWAKRNPLETLTAISDEVEIGFDTADSDDLRAMVADLNEWDAAVESVPVENRSTPLYTLAEKYLRTLKLNYVTLYEKNRLAELMSAEVPVQAVKE
jgi:hypothetical protein